METFGDSAPRKTESKSWKGVCDQSAVHTLKQGRSFLCTTMTSHFCLHFNRTWWSSPGESWPWSLRHSILFILYTAPYWKGREQLHVVVVVCNDRAPEALTMMKSAVMFSASPLVVHIFTQDDLHPVMSGEVRPRSLGWTVHFLESREILWQDRGRPVCALELLFIITLVRLFPGAYLGAEFRAPHKSGPCTQVNCPLVAPSNQDAWLILEIL